MKRWFFIAIATLLTLGGLAWFAAPAMARDYHRHHAPVAVPCYPATGWRHAARHHAHVRHVAHVHAAHVRAFRHAAHRR